MLFYFVDPFPKYLFKSIQLWKVPTSVLIKSDQVPSYPNLRTEHLEILPNLSQRICYQDIPKTMPALSSDEKATFLNIMVKCFRPESWDQIPNLFPGQWWCCCSNKTNQPSTQLGEK